MDKEVLSVYRAMHAYLKDEYDEEVSVRLRRFLNDTSEYIGKVEVGYI